MAIVNCGSFEYLDSRRRGTRLGRSEKWPREREGRRCRHGVRKARARWPLPAGAGKAELSQRWAGDLTTDFSAFSDIPKSDLKDL